MKRETTMSDISEVADLKKAIKKQRKVYNFLVLFLVLVIAFLFFVIRTVESSPSKKICNVCQAKQVSTINHIIPLETTVSSSVKK